MFSRMRRALLNSNRIIKQKLGSDKFENDMAEIQLNLANILC